MRIFLDGCDGTGKTSLADYISEYFKIDKFCLTKDSEKSISRYLDIIKIDNVVFDRTFISEMVYPKVFNREKWMTADDVEYLLANYLFKNPDSKDKFIILTSDLEDIYNRILLRDSVEYPEIMKNLKLINDEYINIANTYDIPLFNTSETTMKEIIDFIERN